MKYRAKCTYGISQVMNVYPDRNKNPMPKDDNDIYIEVDTEEEAALIEKLNNHMRCAYITLIDLEELIYRQFME